MWLAVTASYAETQSTCRQGTGAGLWQIFISSCLDRSTDSSASEGRAQTPLDQLTHKTSRRGKGLLRRQGKSSDLTRHNSETNKQTNKVTHPFQTIFFDYTLPLVDSGGFQGTSSSLSSTCASAGTVACWGSLPWVAGGFLPRISNTQLLPSSPGVFLPLVHQR